MTLIRFPEWTPDLPDLENPGCPHVLNLVPKTNVSYGPWKSPVTLSTNTMDARCQGAVSGADYSGDIFNFMGDTSKLYRYSGSTFSDVSKAFGYTTVSGYTDIVSRAWHFNAYSNAMLGTNFADPVQKFVMGTDATFDDMAKNTAPRAKYMATVQNSLILANTDDAFDGHIGLRIWIGPIGNPLDDDWGNTDKQSDFRTLPSGEVITGIVGGEFGILFCKKTIYRMTYAGPPTIFQIDEITPQHGCVVNGSIAWNENRIFYLAEDGFNTMVNGGPNQPIGQDRVDDYFFKNVDQSKLDRVHATIDEARKLYLVSFPTATSSQGTPNEVLIYNYLINKWSRAEEITDLMQSLASPGLTLEDVGALYPLIDDVPGSYENPAWQGGGDFLAAFPPELTLENFSGPNRYFEIDTPERQLIEGSKSILKSSRPVSNCDCPTLAVGVRDVQTGNGPVFTAGAAPNSITGLCTFKAGAKGRYHRLRMSAPEGWSGDEVAGINGLEWSRAGGR